MGMSDGMGKMGVQGRFTTEKYDIGGRLMFLKDVKPCRYLCQFQCSAAVLPRIDVTVAALQIAFGKNMEKEICPVGGETNGGFHDYISAKDGNAGSVF
jgi:hypothetical protein